MSKRFPVDAVPDRPEFEVRVAGSAVEPIVQRDVIEIDIGEEVNRHGRLTLLVQNWDPDNRAVRYSDDGPFPPGAELEVLIGYHNELESLFAGVITALTAHFSASRGPTMRIEARSKSVLLSHPARSRLFEQTNDGEVAQAIAADYGLDSDVQDGAERPFAVVDSRPDWEYLVERAGELGWVTYVRGDQLVFRPPTEREGDPPALAWGLSLTEIHLTEDLARIADPTVATGWDPVELETVDAEADQGRAEVPTGARPGHGQALEDSSWPLRRRLVPATESLSPDALEHRAVGGARMDALKHIGGYGSTIGLPRLRADSWLDIEAVGERVGGPHYLSAVRHRLSDRGYVTEFQLGLPRPLRPPAEHVDGPSLRIGVVEDLEDPLGWGRVKVSFRWRLGALEPIWARLATLDAGPNQGTLFVPDIGHEVVVGTFGDEGSQPVVLGSLWNGQHSPPEAIDQDKNAVRSVVTRSGHKIRFDDGDAAEIEVATAGGHSIVLTDADSGSIELSEPNGNNRIRISGDGIEIQARSGGVTISAPAGNIAVDGSGFEAKATGPAKVESSATLDLQAAATLRIRGALVNIN